MELKSEPQKDCTELSVPSRSWTGLKRNQVHHNAFNSLNNFIYHKTKLYQMSKEVFLEDVRKGEDKKLHKRWGSYSPCLPQEDFLFLLEELF